MKRDFLTAFGHFVADDERQPKVARALARQEHPQEEELKIFERFADKNSVFVDIGANIGMITAAMAKIVKAVVAFEPMQENIALLEENVRLNNLTNVTVFPVALGSEYGSVRLEAESVDTGGYSISGSGDIKLVPLDSIPSEPSLIKMDVEGYELQVLKGARQTIEKYKPAIFFEMNLIETRKRGDWWLRNVSAELKTQGYALYLPTVTGQKRIHSIAWEMFKQAPKAFLTGKLHFCVNFLALPA